jgi:hypothetical protein
VSEREETVESLAALMAGPVNDVLARLGGDEFTTPEFIALLRTDAAANAVYEEAVRRWAGGREQERTAKMVVHGQVIPLILRASPLVEWAGFAYGEDDAFAVPALWRLVGRW